MADKNIFDERKNERFEKSDSPAPLTSEQLLKMLVKTQEDLAKSQGQLAEAILESRKPYVDPNVLAQKQRELEERRRMIALELREREARKRICPHKRENLTWSISWHEHSGGIVLGVCSRCFSQFNATKNPEDLAILRQDLKSIKNMARAGSHARRGAIIEA